MKLNYVLSHLPIPYLARHPRKIFRSRFLLLRMLQPDNVLCSLSKYAFLHCLSFHINKDQDCRYSSILPESIFFLYRETKAHHHNECDQQIHERHHFSILGIPLKKFGFSIHNTSRLNFCFYYSRNRAACTRTSTKSCIPHGTQLFALLSEMRIGIGIYKCIEINSNSLSSAAHRLLHCCPLG